VRACWTRRCPTLRELELFCGSMATGLGGGPAARVLPAWAALPENRCNAPLFADMTQRLKSGAALSEALAAHPKSFPAIVVRLVREGEAQGDLVAAFERLRGYFKLSRKVQLNPWCEPAFHPLFLLLAVYFIVTLVLTRIVPVYAGVFEDFGARLPAPTRMVIGLHDFACRHELGSPLRGVLAFLLVVGLSLWLRRSTPGLYFFDSVKIRLPIVGRSPYRAAVARFSQALSVLLESSVSVTEGLSLAAHASGNTAFRNVAYMTRRRIQEGDSLTQGFRISGFFDATYCRLLEGAERTKGLAQALAFVALIYAEEAKGWSSGSLTIGSLLLFGSLLFFLGFTIIALYLPVFTLADVVSGAS